MPKACFFFSISALARLLRFSEATLNFSLSSSCWATLSFFCFLIRSISWIARALATDLDALCLD